MINQSAPDAIAIEDIFYGKNVKSLIKQAHVRGVAILIRRDRGIPVFEYSPLEVKQAVVGYGRAEKETGAKDGQGYLEAFRAAACRCSGCTGRRHLPYKFPEGATPLK